MSCHLISTNILAHSLVPRMQAVQRAVGDISINRVHVAVDIGLHVVFAYSLCSCVASATLLAFTTSFFLGTVTVHRHMQLPTHLRCSITTDCRGMYTLIGLDVAATAPAYCTRHVTFISRHSPVFYSRSLHSKLVVMTIFYIHQQLVP